MPLPTYSLTCTEKKLVARNVYELRFTKPEGFAYKAGQHVLLDIPLVEDRMNIQPRAFSLASVPSEDDFLFGIKLTPGGRASRYIDEALQVGDSVKAKGPFGFFVLDRAPGDFEFLFIGTSTGIAPFRGHILDVLQNGEQRRIDLIFGVRSEEDLFWHDELENMSKQYGNFYVHFALSSPSEAWKGHRGRVQTLAPLIAKDFSRKKLYVCGSPDMTNELKKICLEEWMIPKERLHVEGYI